MQVAYHLATTQARQRTMRKPNSPLPSPVFSTPISLGEEQVHLWLLDLRRIDEHHLALAHSIMSTAEHTRAQTFKRGKDNYLASRWLLRSCLARYTGMPAGDITFARTDKGKPFIPHSDIQFSLSHSGHWAVLAIARGRQVGIDLEAGQRQRSILNIAERYYHPCEYAQLRALPAERQSDYFYRLWTLKEAFFKALGTGISAGLEKSQFALHSTADQPAIGARIEPQLSHSTWQFEQWQLAEGELVALAYAAPQVAPCLWFDALAPAFP